MKEILKEMEAICKRLQKDYKAIILAIEKMNETSKNLADDIDLLRTNIKEL